jgi:hypothetical protein
MQGILIRRRVDANSSDPELPGGTDDPAGNLTPVGDQYFFEKFHSNLLLFMIMRLTIMRLKIVNREIINHPLTHFGFRFSRNAFIPSWPSSDARISAIIRAV